jgi:hypothetical protein
MHPTKSDTESDGEAASAIVKSTGNGRALISATASVVALSRRDEGSTQNREDEK